MRGMAKVRRLGITNEEDEKVEAPGTQRSEAGTGKKKEKKGSKTITKNHFHTSK